MGIFREKRELRILDFNQPLRVCLAVAYIDGKTQLREIQLIFFCKAPLLISGIARIRTQVVQMTTFSGSSSPT